MSETQQQQLKYIPLEELHRPESARRVRQWAVEEITERIESSGYNPAKPLRVFERDDGYVIADGNHRVAALRDLGKRGSFQVPCVVEPDSADVVTVAAESNRDEDTYAQEDLFDDLDRISHLREDYTQAEIAEKLGDGWSRDKVAKHARLLENIVPGVLGFARRCKDGGGTENVPADTFAEYWFRTAGLYDLADKRPYGKPGELLPAHPQDRVMHWYVHEKNADTSKNQVQKKVERVAEKCEQLGLIDEQLQEGVDDETKQNLREAAVKGEYTTDTLQTAIENANANAQDRAVFGVDALDRLEEVEDNSIECVVMDPPYGENFASARDTDNPDFEDAPDDLFEILPELFEELDRVTTANAHVYMFFSMTHYEAVYEEFSKWFEVNGTPLIWVKNRHAPKGPGSNGFEKGYAQQYEPILFGRGPKGDTRPLRAEEGAVCPNTLDYAIPTKDERWHDTQKPRPLLRELITNSTATGETVLDPFAGSGATLLAAAETGRHYVGFEFEDKYESRFRREMREVKDE